MKSSILILLILPILAAVAGCGENRAETRQRIEAATGPTIVVVPQSLPSFIVVDGRVTAKDHVEIATRMMARITDVKVDIGDRVHKGDVLIRLGTEDIAANRASAKAAVQAATVAVAEARRQSARMDTLVAVDAVPVVQRDQTRLQLAAAEAQLAMAESSLRSVETAAGYSTIVAPFDGTVASRFADPGDMAAPGMPLLVIQDSAPREGHVAIPASALADVSIGRTMEVSATGFGPYFAKVTSVGTAVDPMTGTAQVILELPNSWIPGSTLTVRVPTGSREGIAVPEQAVVRRGQLTGLRVAGPDGTSIRWVRLGRRITTVDSAAAQIEILSGLEAGERIVL